MSEFAWYTCRDIGYGVEEGEVYATPLSDYDWCGKRRYVTPQGVFVFLFDDEVQS